MNKKTHFLNVHYDFIIFSILKNIHVELLYKKFQVNIRHKKGSISIKLISCCRCLHEAIKANEGAAHCIIYCCSVRISSGFLNFLKKKQKQNTKHKELYTRIQTFWSYRLHVWSLWSSRLRFPEIERCFHYCWLSELPACIIKETFSKEISSFNWIS